MDKSIGDTAGTGRGSASARGDEAYALASDGSAACANARRGLWREAMGRQGEGRKQRRVDDDVFELWVRPRRGLDEGCRV